MTLQSDLEALIGKLEDNLVTMGVTDAEFDPTTGLMGLADEILNISPTITGLQLDTAITCVCPATASVGTAFNITGVLTATYDDTSQTDVDLSGVLQGATVEIYNGNTLLGTCTTGSDGSYTYSYTPSSTGTLSIKAVYDSANDYYEDTASNSSSVSVLVDVSSVSVTATVYDKNDQAISSPASSATLSYVDEEYAVLTATVIDHNNNPVVGETVSFDVVENGSVVENIGSATTDSSGVCSVQYLSKGTGDLNIQCSCNNITSSSVSIEDCYKYYDGEITSLITPNLTLPERYKLEYEIIKKQNVQGTYMRIYIGNNSNSLQTGFDGSGNTDLMIWDGTTIKIISGPELNTWGAVSVEIDSSNHTASITALNTTESMSVNSNVDLTNLYQITAHQYALFRNVKVKSL